MLTTTRPFLRMDVQIARSNTSSKISEIGIPSSQRMTGIIVS
jgi:hypothetical protein